MESEKLETAVENDKKNKKNKIYIVRGGAGSKDEAGGKIMIIKRNQEN